MLRASGSIRIPPRPGLLGGNGRRRRRVPRRDLVGDQLPVRRPTRHGDAHQRRVSRCTLHAVRSRISDCWGKWSRPRPKAATLQRPCALPPFELPSSSLEPLPSRAEYPQLESSGHPFAVRSPIVAPDLQERRAQARVTSGRIMKDGRRGRAARGRRAQTIPGVHAHRVIFIDLARALAVALMSTATRSARCWPPSYQIRALVRRLAVPARPDLQPLPAPRGLRVQYRHERPLGIAHALSPAVAKRLRRSRCSSCSATPCICPPATLAGLAGLEPGSVASFLAVDVLQLIGVDVHPDPGARHGRRVAAGRSWSRPSRWPSVTVFDARGLALPGRDVLPLARRGILCRPRARLAVPAVPVRRVRS